MIREGLVAYRHDRWLLRNGFSRWRQADVPGRILPVNPGRRSLGGGVSQSVVGIEDSFGGEGNVNTMGQTPSHRSGKILRQGITQAERCCPFLKVSGCWRLAGAGMKWFFSPAGMTTSVSFMLM